MDNFKNEMDNLNPTEREKNMIYRNVMDRAEGKKNRFRLLKPVVTFSIIIGISVSAYAIHSNNNFTSKVLDYSISEFSSNQNITSSFGDNLVKCESVFGTDESVFLLLSLENTRGKTINSGDKDLAKFGFKDMILSTEDESLDIENTEFFTLSEAESPSKIYFLIKSNLGMFGDENFSKLGSLNLQLENSNQTTFSKDKYELNIPLDYKSLNDNYLLVHNFKLGDKNCQVDSVSISNLDLLIKFSSNEGGLENLSELAFEGDLPVKLIFKDGISLEDTKNAGSDLEGKEGFLYYSFLNENVNGSDLDYILLNDERIYLK